MKLFGAALIMSACLYSAGVWTKTGKEYLCMLDKLIQALNLLDSELGLRAEPLPQLIARIAERTDGSVSHFFRRIFARMDKLGSRSFQNIWEESLALSLTGLREAEKESILMLGSVLGRYPIPEQRVEIESCRKQLRQALDAAQNSFVRDRKLYWSLSAAAGALLLILLI